MKRDFRKLLIWEKSHQFVLEIYKITSRFPNSEIYSLISQLRRAAVSVPANIVEGCVKSKALFLNHLLIAEGSLEETKYYLILARDLAYLKEKEQTKIMEKCDELAKMIYSFKRKFRDLETID